MKKGEIYNQGIVPAAAEVKKGKEKKYTCTNRQTSFLFARRLLLAKLKNLIIKTRYSTTCDFCPTKLFK